MGINIRNISDEALSGFEFVMILFFEYNENQIIEKSGSKFRMPALHFPEKANSAHLIDEELKKYGK